MASSETVYAAGYRPPDYRDYMWLYTAGDKVEAVVDGAQPGPNGRLFEVIPGKPVKVPWEAGRFILAHMSYTGVVRVNEKDREDGSGTDLDIAGAKKASLALFEEADKRRWRDYVQYVIDDKINNKRVVPPPPDTIKAIMDRRGYKLTDFGVTVPGEMNPTAPSLNEMAALRAENHELKTKLDGLMKKFDEVFGDTEPSKKGGK